MNICRTPGAIAVDATYFRSWSQLAAELGLAREELATKCMFSDLRLGAWKGHWIGRELYAQLGLEFPAQRQPRIGLHPRQVDESRYIGELTDNEGRGDFNTLLAYELASRSLDEIRRRGVKWVVVVAPAAPERFGDENVQLINYLAQGCKDAGCGVVLVFAGDIDAAGECARWEPRWLSGAPAAAVPAGATTAAGTALSAIPGIIAQRFVAETSVRPSEAVALPEGRLVVSPLERLHAGQPARELLRGFLEGEGSLEYQWLAAYAFADEHADDDEVDILFASASHRSAEGGDHVVLKLLERAKRKTADVQRQGWAEAQRLSAVLRLRRWKDALEGPLHVADELHDSVKILLLHNKAWGLVMTNRAAEAEPYFQATRDLMAPRRGSKFYLYLLNVSALNKLRLGDFDAALAFEKVIERGLAAETPTDWHAIYINTINQARLYKKAKDLERSESYYQRAFAITDGVRSESDLLYTCLCLAQLEERKGRLEVALTHWLRTAIHWLSNPVPESLAPRVVEAIVRGPRGEFVEEVSQQLRSYLEAAWRAAGRDPERVREPEQRVARDPSFARVEAATPSELRRALGADGWAVFLGHDSAPPRFVGAEYGRLARCVWRVMRALSGAADLPDSCAIWTDAQLGSDLPCTRDEAIDSAARHHVRTVMFGTERIELGDAQLAERYRGARVALAPSVAGVRRAGKPVVTFKRYLPPLALGEREAELVQRLAPTSTVDSLGADLELVRALEAKHVLRVRTRMVDGDVRAEPGTLATLVPHSPYFGGIPALPPRDAALHVSRFAYIRYERELVVCSPRGYAHLVLHDAEALRVYHALCRGCSVAGLVGEFAARVPAAEVERFVRLLVACAVISTVPDDANEVLRQWSFHDLVLQAESRSGRNMQPIGGTHRFVGELAPPPALKEPPHGRASIELAVPAPGDRYDAATLAQVLDRRASLRTQGPQPITARELGEFLHRTARVISTQATPWPREYPFGGEYTKRPYPNGGSRYELELYITVNACAGLDRGFYYYDPANHRLETICGPTLDMEQLLVDAARASGGFETQVLVTIASRFQRNSWKYEGLALALQLKNVGVLYAHMYLVATAMGLAPCALGAGDSDLFCRLAGTEYLVESSVGELLLGSQPTAS
ncbi:MAG TPA: SagB family peptide dehydrogenase [Kofleriaceae bacterium]|jgi:SagB-type dehydrogenase family enzyme